jgi:hypothetical protein
MSELRTELLVGDDALAFLRSLVLATAGNEDNLLDILDKPWKWQREWELWLRHGKPRNPRDARFDAWIAEVDAGV